MSLPEAAGMVGMIVRKDGLGVPSAPWYYLVVASSGETIFCLRLVDVDRDIALSGSITEFWWRTDGALSVVL